MESRRLLDEEAGLQGMARVAGLAKRALTLSDVDRRRAELWTVSIFVMVAVTIAIALFTVSGDLLPEFLNVDLQISGWIITVLVGGLALAFLIYVLEKERSLRRLAMALVEERVLSTALSNRLTEISRLTELGKAVNTTLDLQDVFHMIISSALELLGGTEGSIMLLDEDKEALTVVSYQGSRYEMVMGRVTPVGQPVAGIVVQRNEPMLLQGDELDGLFARTEAQRDHHIHSSVCVPLTRQGETLGVLNLNECEGTRTFGDGDLAALGFFAEHAAIAIGNAKTFEKERATVTKLEELDRLKSDFVATISHELKTPLTAIIGAAKTVARKGPDMAPEQHTSFMTMIDRQGNKLLRLIEDVLTAGRIESGSRVMRREHLDLRELAEQTLQEAAQSRNGYRGRDLVLRAEPDHPQCWGDMTAILQIMTNLVDNALKYSPENTKVELKVEERAEEAVIQVQDNGHGIEAGELQSIFDRFRQIDSSDTRMVGGVGLGLFIVKSLVDAHGGEIEVESLPNEGTTFRVVLPKRRLDRDESDPVEAASGAGSVES